MSITYSVSRSGQQLFYPSLAAFPSPGFSNITYVAVDTGTTYIWTGSAYQTVGSLTPVGAVASGKTAITGVFSAVGNSSVFEPIAGRDFNLQIIFAGGVTGNVQLEQSLDGGVNFYPLTGSGVAIMRFSSSAVEQWANNEVGARFRLACTAVSGGNIEYRISQ